MSIDIKTRGTCLVLLSLVSLGLIQMLWVTNAVAAGPKLSFLAEYVASGESTEKGKFFASPKGIRKEGLSGGVSHIWIVDLSKNVIRLVQDQQRTYIESPFDLKESRYADDLLFGLSFGTPCPGGGVQATQLGTGTVQGRKVEKWRCQDSDGDSVTVWFDDSLGVALRVKHDEDGNTFELRNIEEGAVSDALFQPPTGYTRQ